MTDYGDENPLYYDYYIPSGELFELKFKSHGDSKLSNRIVSLYNKVGDPDPPRERTTLTYISPGRIYRQNHAGFRASWDGWSWENVLRP